MQQDTNKTNKTLGKTREYIIYILNTLYSPNKFIWLRN